MRIHLPLNPPPTAVPTKRIGWNSKRLCSTKNTPGVFLCRVKHHIMCVLTVFVQIQKIQKWIKAFSQLSNARHSMHGSTSCAPRHCHIHEECVTIKPQPPVHIRLLASISRIRQTPSLRISMSKYTPFFDAYSTWRFWHLSSNQRN